MGLKSTAEGCASGSDERVAGRAFDAAGQENGGNARLGGARNGTHELRRGMHVGRSRDRNACAAGAGRCTTQMRARVMVAMADRVAMYLHRCRIGMRVFVHDRVVHCGVVMARRRGEFRRRDSREQLSRLAQNKQQNDEETGPEAHSVQCSMASPRSTFHAKNALRGAPSARLLGGGSSSNSMPPGRNASASPPMSCPPMARCAGAPRCDTSVADGARRDRAVVQRDDTCVPGAGTAVPARGASR